jgi:hypothetical protein
MPRPDSGPWMATALLIAGVLSAPVSQASDHLDTPTVIADPAADIGDLYAWTSPDGKRLNLAMTIVGGKFSDQLQYVFHIDSGKQFGKTTATTPIVCRFDAANTAACWAGDADHVRGDASKPSGLEGSDRRFRVFVGLRDDPFFNNVKGTRSAYDAAADAMQRGAKLDAALCPGFDGSTSRRIRERWRQTDGGPATNFLAGWKSAALVVSVDLGLVDRGGTLLAVWAGTYAATAQSTSTVRPVIGSPVDRIGRPLTGNALLGPLDPEQVGNRRKEAYNRAAPADWPRFAGDIQHTLGLYDGFDGACGNQWRADRDADPSLRYRALASMLADDRLWVDGAAKTCTRFLAVEFAATGSPNADCGGRTPNYDAIDVYRSLLAGGAVDGVDDGVGRDDATHSTSEFPFLAAP